MTCEIKDYRFIADVMLGKLAKWLRILGFDVLYYSNIDDESILRIVLSQNRILLTKDTRLVLNAKKLSFKYIFIKENNCFYQLKRVISELNVKKDDLCILSRCTQCNTPIKHVRREDVEGLVPDFIYNTVLIFSRCESCGRIYWKGSHQDRIGKILDRLFEK